MNTPFKTLRKTVRQRLPEHVENIPSSEEALFLQSIGDVVPLSGSGRDIVAPPASNAPASWQAKNSLRAITFEMEESGESVSGHVKGLDAKILRRLKSGQMPVQSRLDLHGMIVETAQISVLEAVSRAFQVSKRCLLIIPGKGYNSPLGQGVLRQELFGWLTHEPLNRMVLAFATAKPRHGGSGAVYVLLRHKRTAGKKGRSLPTTD